MKSDLLFSMSTDVNVNFISKEKTKTKHLYSSIQTSVWPNVWKLWPSQAETNFTTTLLFLNCQGIA